MSDLPEFLLARIAEDETKARVATAGPWIFDGQGFATPTGDPFIRAPYHELDVSEEDEEHIARWRPDRVLAECEAKRRIVAYADTMTKLDHEPSATRTGDASVMLRSLSLPYADHPDYREEWRP